MEPLRWRSDGIVPTYTDGESFCWLIEGRISLEADWNLGIAAWAEFANPRSSSRRPMLAVFGPMVHGPHLSLWRLSDPDTTGMRTATRLDHSTASWTVYDGSDGGGPSAWLSFREREAATPLLSALQERVMAEFEAEVEANRLAREADPLIGVMDALFEVAMQPAASDEFNDTAGQLRDQQRLREFIDSIKAEDLREILYRLALDHGAMAFRTAED